MKFHKGDCYQALVTNGWKSFTNGIDVQPMVQTMLKPCLIKKQQTNGLNNVIQTNVNVKLNG